MSSLKQALNRQVNDSVYALNAQGATLDGTPVFPIIESNRDAEEGAPFVPIEQVIFTARFNAFTVIDDNLTIAEGQTLILDEAFLGFTEFRVTTPPIPTGRKGTQYVVTIAPTAPTTVGQ